MKSGTQLQSNHLTTKNKNNDAALTNDDICLTTGIRTAYLERAGTTSNMVGIKKPKRNAFFNRRPQVKSLLLRHPDGPILEEGRFIDSGNRDRDGEFFITPEGMTILAEKVFFEDDKDHTKFNTKNIAFFDNDFSRLISYLENLSLKHGEDAKVLFIQDTHAIPFYIRNVRGTLNVFLIDSEITHKGYIPSELLESIIIGLHHKASITISSSLLQKDAYSCFTFAFQALKYFARHGAEIFPYLSKNSSYFDKRLGLNVLPANKLMPALIKLNQSEIELPNAALNTIVSQKKNMTLGDYLQKFTVMDHGNKRNTAALIKKYKLFDKINAYITSHTDQPVNPDGSVPLPDPLKTTYKKYMR